jgi:hypothetical protein
MTMFMTHETWSSKYCFSTFSKLEVDPEVFGNLGKWFSALQY